MEEFLILDLQSKVHTARSASFCGISELQVGAAEVNARLMLNLLQKNTSRTSQLQLAS